MTKLLVISNTAHEGGGNDVIHKMKRFCLGLDMVDVVLTVETTASTLGEMLTAINALSTSALCVVLWDLDISFC